MKRSVHYVLSVLLLITGNEYLQAQNNLAVDQNPSYAISRDKYMKMADSLNAWHSTTLQETYKAIDFLEDKREARLERKAFNRQLRLIRAGNSWPYNNNNFNDNYYSPVNQYNYRTSSRYYRNPYAYPFRNNNYWGNLPLIVALGLWFR